VEREKKGEKGKKKGKGERDRKNTNMREYAFIISALSASEGYFPASFFCSWRFDLDLAFECFPEHQIYLAFCHV
jgi:hypothetical protein